MYFGVEFCHHLLPDKEDIAAAVEQCRIRKLGFTLLTPYVTDSYLEEVDSLVATMLEHKAPTPEVVVNDWGVLRRLKRIYGDRIDLILGRGLNRMMRDPRLPDLGPEHLGGDDQPQVWQEGSFSGREFRGMLAEQDIDRVELDYPLQGLNELQDGPLRYTLHLPFGMIATGRNCMVSSYGKPPSVRFMVPVVCDAPCRRFTLRLRAPWSRRELGSTALPLLNQESSFRRGHPPSRRVDELPEGSTDPAPRFLQKGNSHFYELDDNQIQSALQWAERQSTLDRIVVEPDLPM
jgi:hypothetical protein